MGASSALTDVEDADLMQRVALEDEEAYGLLVIGHTKAIWHIRVPNVPDAGEAEDLTQERFLKVWTKARTWHPNKVQCTTWLHQIARNPCIDAYRKQRFEFDHDTDVDALTATRQLT